MKLTRPRKIAVVIVLAANIIAADLRLRTPWTPMAKPEWRV